MTPQPQEKTLEQYLREEIVGRAVIEDIGICATIFLYCRFDVFADNIRLEWNGDKFGDLTMTRFRAERVLNQALRRIGLPHTVTIVEGI